MESKRKGRRVLKVSSETHGQENKRSKAKNAEDLIFQNAEMVEDLFSSPAWSEIAMPLLLEKIASVSGRFTSGRFYHGELTRKWDGNSSVFFAGYQKGLMDFLNELRDFIDARDRLVAAKKLQKKQDSAPMVNPMSEDLYEE